MNLPTREEQTLIADFTSLRNDLTGCLRDRADELIERLQAEQNEVASVLMLMDGLAEQWGDEGVFRRCRDRLRAIVPKESNQVPRGKS